jgi:outer membrane protein OmpA-like peptidoglycan-associated protein/Tol biopolymer transport system component
MKYINHIISFLLLIVLAGSAIAQPNLTTDNKKAIKFYQAGKQYYDARNNELAELNFLSALEKDPNFAEAELLLAYVYTENGAIEKAITHYQKSIKIKPDLFPETYASVGGLLLKLGRYDEAKNNFETYLAQTSGPLMMKPLAEDGLRDAQFAIEALKHPVPFKPINLGEGVNSAHPEYFPSLSVDGTTLLYTRRLQSKSTSSGFNEDFYVSVFDGKDWLKSRSLIGVNSMNNEGAPTLSANGQLLIFTICAEFGDYGVGKKGYGSCDLFYSYRTGKEWSKPKNLRPPINTRNWETQPSFSSDGKTLYFVRGVGRGMQRQQDIFTSELSEQGIWSKPVRLSNAINTKGTEESVFIHPDGITLYFASNGHAGMGGLDLYKSIKQPDGSWSKPVNLGYPINTFADENSLLVSAGGKIAYFASDREGGYGALDLYQFELPEDARPESVTYLKGKVYDKKTKELLSARFELIDLETGEIVVRSFSDEKTGEYLVCLPPNKDYALNVSHDGYLFHSENFTLKKSATSDPFKKDVPLNKIEVGTSVVLKNVFFETAKFDLKPKSKVELDKLIKFLTKNATLKIELGGHTDNVGNVKSNQILSENRAKAVYTYLLTNGITEDRLSTKGYGDTKPIADNDTKEGRAENRRTEFKIISK